MFKIINGGKMPTRGTKYSAGLDLYANDEYLIKPQQTLLVSTGVALDQAEIDKREGNNPFFRQTIYAQLHIRSSLALKGLILTNGVGVIDIDYPDEIKLIISNISNEEIKVSRGNKIGQLIFIEHSGYLCDITSEVDRDGGFGSTGE
jgi:dUTP pyrophosphatase